MFEGYLFYTDDFLDAHQLEFKEATALWDFEDKEENEDLAKIFGIEKKFIPEFNFQKNFK